MLTRDIETLDYYIISTLAVIAMIAVIVVLIKKSEGSTKEAIKRVLSVAIIPFLLGVAFMGAIIFCLKDYA